MLATRLRCSSTAPLLTPVVPPVYCSTAMSSGPTCAGLKLLPRPCDERVVEAHGAAASSNAGTIFFTLRTT